jgi:L-malate glycosyltransferase
MKIGYFMRNIGVSGGVKILLQHVHILEKAGYDVKLMAEKVKTSWGGLPVDPLLIKEPDLSDMPDCDVYVGAGPNDVKRLHKSGRGQVVHLCEGYEPIEYRARLDGESVTEKYTRKGAFAFVERFTDNAKFKKRIREIEAVYALPTVKAAISKHLAELVENIYRQPCTLIQCGIDATAFYPDPLRTWGKDGRIRCISVGSLNVGFKGMPDTLDAIESLKKRGVNLELIRISPGPPSEREQKGGVVDRYLMGINEDEMAALYRDADIYISSSLEGEGFGLPAIEALASGIPSILTEISSYKNFRDDRSFARFVPTHSPDSIAEAILAFMNDAGLRSACIEKGLAVAAMYTLERTRTDLLRFMEKLA